MTRRGFTLLEVVLAIALSLGMMGVAIAFYYRAANVREILTADVQESSTQRVILDRVAAEMQDTMSYPFLGTAMEGTVDEKTNLPAVRFVTARLPGPGVWTVRKSTEKPLPPETDLQLVGYRLSTWTDEYDRVHVSGLERTCQKLLTASQVQEGKEITVTMISTQIKFLRIRYFDGVAWSDQWSGRDLPLAVEIVMGKEELPPGSDPNSYGAPTLRRMIYLPGGSKAMGTIIKRGDSEP